MTGLNAMRMLATLVVVPRLGALLSCQSCGAKEPVLRHLQLGPLESLAHPSLHPVIPHPRHTPRRPYPLWVQRLADALPDLVPLLLQLADVTPAELGNGGILLPDLLAPPCLVGLPVLQAGEHVVIALQGLDVQAVQVGQLHGRRGWHLPPSAGRADELEVGGPPHLVQLVQHQLHNSPYKRKRRVGRVIRMSVARPEQDRAQEATVRRVALPPGVEVVRGHEILLEPPRELVAERIRTREDPVGDGGQHVGERLEVLVGPHAEVDTSAHVGLDESRWGEGDTGAPIKFHGVLSVH
mmetsp:Transcript_64737/g.173414  ORF Transcript_64737/g.173414 Transcript_64737/m.173414 type:complete len:296 (+) Transcript_64737:1957-2844(+)